MSVLSSPSPGLSPLLTSKSSNLRLDERPPHLLLFPSSSPDRLDDIGRPTPDTSPYLLFKTATLEENHPLDRPALLSPFATRLSARLETVKTQQDSENDNAPKLHRGLLSSFRRPHSLFYPPIKSKDLNRLSRKNRHHSLQISAKRQLSEKRFLLNQSYLNGEISTRPRTKSRFEPAIDIRLQNKAYARAASLYKTDTLVLNIHKVNRSRSLEFSPQSNGRVQDTENEEIVPTEPVTPTYFATPVKKPEYFLSTPIIPPTAEHDDTFRLHLTSETIAKIRIGKYKEREGTTIEQDHLRFSRNGNTTKADVIAESENSTIDNDLPLTLGDWEAFLGLGKTTRESVLDWFIRFLPVDDSDDGYDSCFSPTHSVGTSSHSRPPLIASRTNLIDQLETSPETRFHAAWMFLRYFYIIRLDKLWEGTLSDRGSIHPQAAIWDLVLASLAISVKFHRDFLSPLLPVEVTDYIEIAPHKMQYRDFERAQRNILDVFSYHLGVTPQPFLDQVWIALPSLRELLKFDGAWNQVRKETWKILFQSLYVPDACRFLVSVLTTTALVKALVSVLAQQYYYQSDWNAFYNFNEISHADKGPPKEKTVFEESASDDAESVITDIQAIIGISDAELNECRQWLDSYVC